MRRTGPFMPPITLPAPLTGTCVVSADFKAKIEAAGLTHSPIRYIAVEKYHICEFRWDLWDRNNEDPDEWPDGDEPEDYIDNRPHSETAAIGLGDIYEMIVPVGAQYRSVKSPTEIVGKTFLVASTWDGSHLFRAANEINPHYFRLICDEVGMKWLEDNAGGFVEFQALGTVP